MARILGERARVGVLVPATNTVVEPELYAMAPHGVTFHFGRMRMRTVAFTPDVDAQELVDSIRAGVDEALRAVLACEPTCLMVGQAAIAYRGGVEGHRRFKEELEREAGLPVTTAPDAIEAALAAYDARRVAIVSPYAPAVQGAVNSYLAARGCEVVATHRIVSPSAVAIADVEEAALRDALAELARSDADVLLQVGTDLPMARLAGEAERWLGKPVICTTTALLWHLLGGRGIPSRIYGFGSLLAEH